MAKWASENDFVAADVARALAIHEAENLYANRCDSGWTPEAAQHEYYEACAAADLAFLEASARSMGTR